MEQTLKRLDFERTIGSVELTDGKKLPVPKLSMLKIIKIVKFLGIDGMKLYEQMREILVDNTLDDLTKLALILENLKEEQLIHIFSILLELEDEDTLNLDPNEMLDVLIMYVEKTNIAKTFTQVRQLYKKMFNKELPDIATWFKQRAEAGKQIQAMREQAMNQAQESGNQ
jgi:succinate dehydrogenase flavin-adding protein (antitoxin of CptAB toxin-antitoxin module)